MAEGYQPLDRQGFTSTIYHLPGDPPRVCKAFHKDNCEILYPFEILYSVEKAVYERFAAHDHPASILKYYGTHESIPDGIILELAENKDVLHYLSVQKRLHNATPDDKVLYRWASQAAEALEFAHSVGVYNSDIHCLNFFLDRRLNLKVADWAGASIDGSRSCSSYRLRHRWFDSNGTDVARAQGITAATEIFALGTAIYYMVTGHDPWPDLREPRDRELIKKHIIDRDFPATDQLRILGNVIRKCWFVEFVSMSEVKRAIDAEEDLYNSRNCTTESFPESSPSKPA